MKRVLLSLALVLAVSSSALAAWPQSGFRPFRPYQYNPAYTQSPSTFYYFPSGGYGYSSPTVNFGYTPATVYSPWLYSPYSGGYGYGGYGGYGYGGIGVY